MIEKEHFPRIRFKSFSEEWKLCKLKDISEQVIRKNINLESTLPLTISAQYGLVDQTTFFNNQVAGQNISSYYLIRKGEFAYNKSTSQDYPVGAVKRLERYEMGILSTLYILFRLQNTVSSDYLVAYFDSTCWHKEITARAAEGARNHGLLNISSDDFFDIDIYVPGNMKEQESTGIFLRKIEQLILEKRAEYKKILKLKKTMLKKMFPQSGSDVPEIRMKGFEGPWKKYRLSTIAKKINRNIPDSNAPIMMITSKDGFISQSERYSFDNSGESLGKYILLKENELAYNHGASKAHPYGSCYALAIEEARIPFVYHCFSVKDNNSRFVSMELNGLRVERQLKKIVSSSARMDGLLNISFEEYCLVSIFLPEIQEQEKIVNYFDYLDLVINLCYQKVEKLQILKKALIEKMFI